jgi:hypothetical protein
MKHSIPKLLGNGRVGLRGVVLGCAALLLVAGVAPRAHSWFRSNAVSRNAVSRNETPASAQTPVNPVAVNVPLPIQSLEAEYITITSRGFEPAEITRSGGHFLLAVDNRSGLDDVALTLDLLAGNRLQQQRVSRSRSAWRVVVDLPPGRYVLGEANHSRWRCQLTITAL